MKIEYHEVSAEEVVKFFVDAYILEEGKQIFSNEWFYDAGKQKFVFRLTIEAKPC